MNLQSGYTERLRLRDNKTYWDATHRTKNDHQYWNKGYFGASPVANRLINLVRDKRTTALLPETNHYLAWLESATTEQDEEDLMVQALLLAHFTEKDGGVAVDFDYAYGIVIQHIIDQTASAFAVEARGMRYLRKNFPECDWQFSTQIQDKGWGVDIIGRDQDGQIVVGISFKPVSYANGYYKNPKIHNNRHKEHRHHTSFLSANPKATVKMWVEDSVADWSVTPIEKMGCYICDQSHQRVA